MGLYSLSSSVGWKVGDFAASEVSLGFPFRLGSTSILRLKREFSCLSASISSTLRFFKFTSSCCIFAPFGPPGITPGGQIRGDARRSKGTSIRLLVHFSFATGGNHLQRKTGTKGVCLVPHGGHQLFLQKNKSDELTTSVTLPCSPLSPQLVSPQLIHVSLNP